MSSSAKLRIKEASTAAAKGSNSSGTSDSNPFIYAQDKFSVGWDFRLGPLVSDIKI